MKIRGKRLIREAITLLSGKVVAQIISFLAYLLLTRLFSPDDFGLYNLFYSPVELLIIFSTCKLELAIVAADTNKEAAALTRFSLRLNSLISLLLLVIIAILCLTNALPGRFHALGFIALLIPPMVFFCGTSRIYYSIYNRLRTYHPIAISEVAASLSTVITKTIMGVARISSWGMPIGTVAGQMVANINLRLKLKDVPDDYQQKYDFPTQKAVVKKGKRYPLFLTTKEFVSTLSGNMPFFIAALPIALLPNIPSTAEIGIFGLAMTCTMRPINILNSSFERVLFAHSSEQHRNQKTMLSTVLNFLFVLNIVLIPTCVVAYFFAPNILSFCFGERWTMCGEYIKVMLPWIFFSVNAAPLMYVSNIFSTQHIDLILSVVMLIGRIVALIVGLNIGDFRTAIALFSWVTALVWAIYLWWYLHQVAHYDKQIKNKTI